MHVYLVTPLQFLIAIISIRTKKGNTIYHRGSDLSCVNTEVFDVIRIFKSTR